MKIKILSIIFLCFIACENKKNNTEKNDPAIEKSAEYWLKQLDIEDISGTKLTDLKMSCDSSIPGHSFCSYQWQSEDSISIKAISGNFYLEQYYHIGLSEISSISDDEFTKIANPISAKEAKNRIQSLVNDKTKQADSVIYASKELIAEAKRKPNELVSGVGDQAIWDPTLEKLHVKMGELYFTVFAHTANSQQSAQKLAQALCKKLQ